MSHSIQILASMFPSMPKETIATVLYEQGGALDKACTELDLLNKKGDYTVKKIQESDSKKKQPNIPESVLPENIENLKIFAIF